MIIIETRGNSGSSTILLAKINNKEQNGEGIKNNFKTHSKYKYTKKGNFIKIYKGSIVILNDKGGMCNFKNLEGAK